MSVSLQIDKTNPVMVTGATGYVAGWLVKRLLDEGLTVHAAVRDPDNPEKLKFLNELAGNSPGQIRYFKADLLDEGAYDEAMAGCGIVFHTASPFVIAVEDPQTDLVDPALLGTRNVLNSVNRTASVSRVVLTSSCAAILGDGIDSVTNGKSSVTESDWNGTSSLAHQPYSYSKTVAEKEAWAIATAQSRWKLVVINPSLVIGPGINPFGTSESFRIVEQLGNGTMKVGAPPFGLGIVDVRDVADAHLRAAYIPAAEGRHITSAHNTSLLELANAVRSVHGDKFPVPEKELPKWLLWVIGPVFTKGLLTRKYISRNAGFPWLLDNSKSQRELGMAYRPLSESVNDHFQQMVETGRLIPSN